MSVEALRKLAEVPGVAPTTTFTTALVGAVLELDDRLNHFGKLREEAIDRPVVNWPNLPPRRKPPEAPLTVPPTSESICGNGEPEKLARGIYERLRKGRSGLIWAVSWPDLPPEISRRWVEAVAEALAERDKKP